MGEFPVGVVPVVHGPEHVGAAVVTRTVLVAGTWAWRDDNTVGWYCPGHPFGQFLAAQGVPVCYDGARPFEWSTGLGGVPLFGGATEWPAGGAALSYFVDQCGCQPVNAIAHSHGLQVAAYAAAEHGTRFNTLISVGSPLRKDMAARYAVLRKNTRYWLHIHSDGSDRWQWFGELCDGNWRAWLPGGHSRIVRTTPLADANDFVPKVGHSDLLYTPSTYHFWTERGWLGHLKG